MISNFIPWCLSSIKSSIRLMGVLGKINSFIWVNSLFFRSECTCFRYSKLSHGQIDFFNVLRFLKGLSCFISVQKREPSKEKSSICRVNLSDYEKNIYWPLTLKKNVNWNGLVKSNKSAIGGLITTLSHTAYMYYASKQVCCTKSSWHWQILRKGKSFTT